MTPEELKNRSLRVTHQVEGTPSEEKDLIELDILQASENLEKYQQETTKWRDKKIVKKDIAVGDWVLKRKPNAETSGKLQPKWEGPFLVIKSNRSGHITCPTPKAISCSILRMRTVLKSTTFKIVKRPHRETISDRGPSQTFSVLFTL